MARLCQKYATCNANPVAGGVIADLLLLRRASPFRIIIIFAFSFGTRVVFQVFFHLESTSIMRERERERERVAGLCPAFCPCCAGGCFSFVVLRASALPLRRRDAVGVRFFLSGLRVVWPCACVSAQRSSLPFPGRLGSFVFALRALAPHPLG